MTPPEIPPERAARPTLGVVVVSYRRYDLLEACLASLAASTRRPDTIVIVDNDSDPGRLAAVTAAHPAAVAIGNPDNRGYAAACNQGRRAAGTDLVLFLNGDVTVAPDCLARCVDALTGDTDVGIVTARLERPDGSLDHACHRGLPTPAAGIWYRLGLHRRFPGSRRFGAYTMSWLDLATDHDVEACSGAFLLIPDALLRQVGGWDEAYWFYAEDLDLCLRVARAGRRVRYVADARATHVKGASSNVRVADERLDASQLAVKRRVQRAIVDSHQRFFRRHLAPTTNALVRAAVELGFTIQRRRIPS